MNIEILSKKVVLMDLDGTLIDTATGATFPKTVADFKIKHDIIEALQKLVRKGMVRHIAIVTNQGGVEAGHYTEAQIIVKVRAVADVIEAAMQIDDKMVDVRYAICTTNDKADENRKPNIGMFVRTMSSLAEDNFKYDNSECVMVGDASGKPGQFSNSDLKFAENAGIDYIDVNDFAKIVDEA